MSVVVPSIEQFESLEARVALLEGDSIEAPLVLEGQEFNLSFREDFTDPDWLSKVYEWGPPGDNLDVRWYARPTTHFGQAVFVGPDSDVFQVGPGGLKIKTTKRASDDKWTTGILCGVSPDRLNGYSGFRQVGGYFEAEYKCPSPGIPKGGSLSSFWLMSKEQVTRTRSKPPDETIPYQDADYMPILEIDVAEIWNREPKKIYPNFHHWSEAHTDLFDLQGGYFTGVDLTEDFHKYGVWVKEHEITWYFDREPFHTEPLSGSPERRWCRNRSWFMLINNQVDTRGGTEIPNDPSFMEIKQIRAYKEVV